MTTAAPPAAPIDFAAEGKKLRRSIAQTLVDGGRGHVASAFSLVEILLVLYRGVMRFSPQDPKWADRDRMILSKGHGCLALYAILADLGFFPKEELKKFCRADGILGGHPEHHKIPGVEASTGALGHGLSIGVGMALSARMDGRDYRVYAVLGDGECDEGSVWEAALSASKHKLDNLIVLVDYNKQQSYDYVSEVLPLEPFSEKWRAFGFEAHEVDMDKPQQLLDLLTAPRKTKAPLAVICHTIKGKGVSFMEGDLRWHHKTKLTDEEVRLLFSQL